MSHVMYSLDTDIAKYSACILEIDVGKRHVVVADDGNMPTIVSVPFENITTRRTMNIMPLDAFGIVREFPYVFKVTFNGVPLTIQHANGIVEASSAYCVLADEFDRLIVGNDIFNIEQI